jgi:hypothetical protein
VEALKKKERQGGTQLTTKIDGKLVWIPVILFCKIFIPGYLFDALLCPNWPFLILDLILELEPKLGRFRV